MKIFWGDLLEALNTPYVTLDQNWSSLTLINS